MLYKIIQYSIHHKLIVLLFTLGIVGFGLYAFNNLTIGAVPDVTNNQVQIITTSKNLATEDIEKFITYPVELEMANLPGVKEIRSISKFGLSVVTVVFTDEMGTYLPRQLIAEKLKAAEEKIPEIFGKPFMGPITTGLGEIYQYTLEVDKTHQKNYSLSDLRTIQDWQIRRQLSGINGVVEVNTWGGHLKQYEVAINPEKLKSLQISIAEVYDALANNNNIAGGGYIEKTNQTYFIRGEGLVKTLNDIENIVINKYNSTPIYIKNIGEVTFGIANRFGAVTGNGEGEKVLGQVMMLKDANSKQVLEDVKKRVTEIEKTLPEGIHINPFLERSELIGKTTFTIAENLILGCLIVIFVVVILLGNIRSGLVVASVIPLCLLFAISLMYIFKVDANLMSLGAIDFGIIIDGAVIIVEYIAFKITQDRNKILAVPKENQQTLIDEIAKASANKMMHSAIFGQLIIVIVFIPILSLVGVEGKMFKPMALVFCYALLGAMILCFTYVPVMASLFIKPDKRDKKSIAVKLFNFLEEKYQPTISWALRNKKKVMVGAGSLLVIAGILFSSMGGEFVPTLDEGDFVIQPILKTGTTLSNTIEITTQIEQKLKKFPEVVQVVSRIGAAEVPTDPMSMEESDVIIKLKPKSEWISAESKDELADKFKESLTDIPGIDFEFTQPIEMRFNELISGTRTDLAIKIFGEDLSILFNKATEIEKLIKNIPGAADISVEKITGLPQMTVTYDRQKIAKYGLNINLLNQAVSTGFAGLTTGMVFEGEKQFDLVMIFDKNHRTSIEDLANTPIIIGNQQLPLSEFATIAYDKGPAKISRDNTKRRIVIGVNVRNRDLESVVQDVQKVIKQKVNLPNGYQVTYGGQFENLRNAKSRLMIAVPIALVLIFILLYFAFNSVKEALIIYSAIPLSAVGGILFLYVRDLPFSISAGVGFIALFGIAVLNGIVLIEEFKALKAQGVLNINKRIILGTKNRLRPVLLTASAATFGFLPMAISYSSGAEVQRPLATVVVGGLISATLLTLIVLPILYALFDRKTKPKKTKKHTLITSIIIIVVIGNNGFSQQKQYHLSQLKQMATQENLNIKNSENQVKTREKLINSGFDFDKTEIFFSRDQNNIALNNIPLNVWGINQKFEFPTTYFSKLKYHKAQYNWQQYQHEINLLKVNQQIEKLYYEMVFLLEKQKHYKYLHQLYVDFAFAAQKRYETGETNYLEKLTATAKQKEIQLALLRITEDIRKQEIHIKNCIQQNDDFSLIATKHEPIEVKTLDTIQHPTILLQESMVKAEEANLHNLQQNLLPDINLSLFKGNNNGINPKTYYGYFAGLSFPILYTGKKSKIGAQKYTLQSNLVELNQTKQQLINNYHTKKIELDQLLNEINSYKDSELSLANEITHTAKKAFENGEINFLAYVQLLENAKNIELAYITKINEYNQLAVEINNLTY